VDDHHCGNIRKFKKKKHCRLETVFSKKQVLKLCKKLEEEWMRRAGWFFGVVLDHRPSLDRENGTPSVQFK
jgi:hypothetical protein